MQQTSTDFQQLSIRTTLGPLSLSPVIFKPIILLLSNEDNTTLEASVSSSLNKDNTYIHSFVERINKPMYTQWLVLWVPLKKAIWLFRHLFQQSLSI